MNSIMNWYTRNYEQITWFIIGWMALATIDEFSKGNLTQAGINLFLLAVNYYFVRQR